MLKGRKDLILKTIKKNNVLREIDANKNKIFINRLEKLFTLIEINFIFKISRRPVTRPPAFLPYKFKF